MTWVLYILTLCGPAGGLALHECWRPLDGFDTKEACEYARANPTDLGTYECAQWPYQPGQNI